METDKLVKLIKQSEDEVENALKDIGNEEDFEVVLLIGPTGSGKTTLFYGIMNKTLKVIEQDYLKVLEPEERIKGFKVGHSYEAETTIPNLYYDSENKVLYCDCPGFFDTRGEIQDIANSFSIDQLLNCSKHFKILFVISIFDIISGKGKDLVDGCFMLEKMISKESEIQNSICLIITHCDSNQNINNLLLNNFGTFEPQILSFFKSHIDTNVFLFPNPNSSENSIYNDFNDRKKILDFIMNMNSTLIFSHKIILSTSAKEQILSSAACFGNIPELLEQFIKNIKEEYLIQGINLTQWKNKIEQLMLLNFDKLTDFRIKVSQIIQNHNKYLEIYEKMDKITPWIEFVKRVSSSLGITDDSIIKNSHVDYLCLNINEHFRKLLRTCEIEIDNMIELKRRQEEQRQREIEAARLAAQQRQMQWEIKWRKYYPIWQKPIPPVPYDWWNNELQTEKCIKDVSFSLLKAREIGFYDYRRCLFRMNSLG